MSRLRFSLRCLLFGHDDLVRRSPDRLYLQCSDCGRETAGWPLAVGEAEERARASDRVQVVSPARVLIEPVRH